VSRAALRIGLIACMALPCTHVIAGEETIQLVDAPGRELTAGSCVTCHSLDYIPMNAPVMNHGSWEKTVHKMIDKFGAPVRPEDIDQIVAYLTANYSG
jgi:hypothetical protein